MLTALEIKHFVFIEELTVHFKKGMTVLTGETGAGKSILCDALWLALGINADKTFIQTGKSLCTVNAYFNLETLPHVQKWLKEKGYFFIEDKASEVIINHQCCLTRIIPREGRTQALINNKAASIQDLKKLGSLLVALHGQHEQQRLLKLDQQRECLDQYGQYRELVQSVQALYFRYTELKRQNQQFAERVDTQEQQLALLEYQLEELKETNFHPAELEGLDQEQRRLAHAQQVLENGYAAVALMSEAEPVHLFGLFQNIQEYLQKISGLDNRFEAVYKNLEETGIQIKEAELLLRHTLEEVIIDPERLQQVDQRLSQLHALARKHGVSVETLPYLTEKLEKERDALTETKHQLTECKQALKECLANYQPLAQKLTEKRCYFAKKFQDAITQQIQTLGMTGGRVEIRLIPIDSSQTPTRFGYEQVEFYLSAAPGQSLQTIGKGASGGELSRLSLVIQSLIAEVISVPTLIFDEVDVGVGGGVGERIGHLLHTLGKARQVLCITHLPQVAALGNHHYQILKCTDVQRTHTKICYLESDQARVQEIARMLGGININAQTIAHAKVMLGIAI